MADIVLDVGFNQDDVDKEIDKLEKKMSKYDKSLDLATKSVNELEAEYQKINANLEIEESLHGKNTAEVKSLKLELQDVNKKLQEEYAIMDSIKKKREETNSLYRQAHLDPTEFSKGIQANNISKAQNIDSGSIGKLSDSNQKATNKMFKLKDAIGQVGQKTLGLKNIMLATSNAFSGFLSRVVGLAKRVFIFSVITMSFRHMRASIGDVIKANDQLSASLSTIKFNLQVAFLPIYSAILPALQNLITWLAKATSYIAAFFNTLAGKNIKQSQQAIKTFNSQNASAKSLSKSNDRLANSTKKMAGAAKKANEELNKQLAGFDELNDLSKSAQDDVENIANALSKESEPNNLSTSESYSPAPIIEFDTSQAEQSAQKFKEKLTPIIDSIKDSLSDSFSKFKANIDFEPLMTSLGNLKEKLKPFNTNVGSGLKWFLDNVLAKFGEWVINNAAPSFLNMLGGAIDFLNGVIEVAKDPLLWLWNNFLQPIAQWTGGVICNTMNTLGQKLTDVGNWMQDNKSTVEGITTAVVAFFAAWEVTKLLSFIQISGGVVGALTKITAALFGATLAKIKDKAETIALSVMYAKDFVVSLANGTAAIAKQVVQWGLLTGAKIFDSVKTLAQTVATNAMTAAQWLLNAAMNANPIGIIVLAIGALIAAFVLLWNNCEGFRNFWIGLWDKILETCQNAWNWISNAFNSVIEWIKKNWQGLLLLLINPFAGAFKLIYDNCEGFRNFIDNIVSKVKEFFENLWTRIGELASECWNKITELWGKLSDWVNDNIVKPVTEFFQKMWDKIKNIFSHVAEFFKNAFKNAYEGIKKVFSGIGGFFGEVWDKIKSKFTEMGTKVGNAIGGAFSKVINGVINFAEEMINKFISSINSAISLINKLPGVNIPVIPDVSLPKMPYLAQGAVIPPNRKFLAVLGDQKNGTNIEAPLDTIKQAVAEVMAQYSSNNGEYTFVAQLDGRTLFKETVKQDKMFKKQSGKSAFAY